MILVATTNIARMTDAILWASVEFGVQCEAYIRKVYDRDQISIIDLTELSQMSGDMIWVVGHGSPNGITIEVRGGEMSWTDFGMLLAPSIPPGLTDVYFTSCYAAAGTPGSTGIDKVWKGISAKAKSVKVHGYIGPVISNIVTGPIQVVDDKTTPIRTLFNEQEGVVPKLTRNSKLASWRQMNPTASRSKIAEAASEVNWDFYKDFTTVFSGKNYFYGPTTEGAKEIVVP